MNREGLELLSFAVTGELCPPSPYNQLFRTYDEVCGSRIPHTRIEGTDEGPFAISVVKLVGRKVFQFPERGHMS